jgi:hypothetical protein
MARVFNRSFCFAAVILCLLLFSVLRSFPEAYAAEPTIEQKGISILGNVAGLDLTHYSVTSKQPQQYLYLNEIKEDVMTYTLQSTSSKLKFFCTFANSKLHILHALETQGTPVMTKASNCVREMAQNYLDDYTAYTKYSLYTELGTMLKGVETNENSTITCGNVKLQVNVAGDYTTFSWIYTLNGVNAADKCIALGYSNGFLKYFVDTWDLYAVGSMVVNLSEEEAVAIAMQKAKTFSYKVGLGNNTSEVKEFSITRVMVAELVFCSSIGADQPRRAWKLYGWSGL